MFDFLAQNLSTLLVAFVLGVVLALIIRKLRRDKKNGLPCACSNACAHCAASRTCHADRCPDGTV